MLVPLNWRLAVAEQLFILSDALVKVLCLNRPLHKFYPRWNNACLIPELLAWIFRLRAESRSMRWRSARTATAATRMST